MTEPSLPEKVSAIDAALERGRISHAFGGALALAYYAEPRTTIDVDVNVFGAPDCHPQVAAALTPLGVETGTDPAALARDGQCRIWWGRTPLDLFYAYDEIHDAMAEQARRVPFGDGEIPILSPEHLIVCKAVFDRAKDWIDIEQMLTGVDHLDVPQVERDLARLAGADDPRTVRFVELADELRGPADG
ncbi:MAG: hypothetical protein QOI10_2605 [Solirubrobacterales bacterium]|jgi:hypothetical protein|nr:hypothetical protein [Solirubrobacterales bacterium]